MIIESVLSCSYLLLTSGSCIYTLRKESYEQYSKLLPHFTCAFFGIATIAARSFVVLVYKLFLKTYTFDPAEMLLDEEKNRLKSNLLDRLLDTLSMASLIYSLYCHHGYCLLGACIVTSLSFYDLFTLGMAQLKENEANDVSSRRMSTKSTCIFFWVLFNGCFAYAVENNYALVANYPYLVTNWALPAEGFYQGWTIKRTINDYMMAAHVILMTEALRQTRGF